MNVLFRRYHKIISILLISFLGIIVYSDSFHCSFHLDDRNSIVENLFIRNLGDLHKIWDFLPLRFILYLSIAFNYHFNGLDVFGYHVFNLSVHLATAIFVWWLVLLTLSTPTMKENKITRHANLISLLAGLVFVAHPVQTQAVTYIVQRAASMATLFYVASLCFYIKSKLTNVKIYYIFSLITAVLAMFTKETAISLPLMVLLYEFCFFKTTKKFNWAYAAPFLITIFIIPLTFLLTESPDAQQMRGVVSDGPAGISPMHYLLTQFRVMVTYIRLVFIPLNQNLDYDYPVFNSLFELPTLFSFLFLIAVLFAAIRLFSKYRLVSFSILWFFLTLLPESSIFPIRDVIFEHRLYLPMVGFSIFLASGIFYLLCRHSERSEESKGVLRSFASLRMTIITLTLIIGINSVLTYQRNKVWRDELTLWSDVAGKSPHKARVYYSLGHAYDKLGQSSQALLNYNKAIELKPDYEEAYNNRGVIYSNQKNLDQAITDYTKAIEIDPTDAIAYNDRGNIYAKQGKFTQAVADYSMAIEIKPGYEEAHSNRGKAYDNRGRSYVNQGKIAQAISEFNKGLEENPGDLEAYNARGNCWAMEGNFARSLADFNKAIEINPNYAEIYYNRGLVFDRKGNFTQAISDFTKAIEINPKYAQSYTDRGLIYEKQGHLTQAMSDYNKAIGINPQYAIAYNNRAVDDYQLKKYDNALADARKAKKLGYAVTPYLINALKSATGHDF